MGYFKRGSGVKQISFLTNCIRRIRQFGLPLQFVTAKPKQNFSERSVEKIFIFSFLLTIISVYLTEFHSPDTENSFFTDLAEAQPNPNVIFSTQNAEKIEFLYVLFIRFIHYAFTIYMCFYIFIFNEKYDIYYFIFFCLLLLHWIFLDECYLSKVENEYYKKNNENINNLPSQYKAISVSSKSQNQSTTHPYLQIFFKENTDWFILFQGIMMAINISYIIHRSLRMQFIFRILLTLFLVITMIYLMVKDRINLFSFTLRSEKTELP